MATHFVEGGKIDIGFDGKRCIHARNCVLGNPAVFEANAPGQWLHPDAAPVEAIVAIVESCPSGALSYRRKDGAVDEAPPAVNTVRLRENGPLAVHADIALGEETMLRTTLCRCGASQRKPYCDGSHARAGFIATGEPASRESLTFAERGGRLTVTPQPNGCLKLEGNLEIVSGTGRGVERVRRAFLCRCGHSKSKPWCDGSHKEAGFVG
jgi:CDGSH-type Zn-finger protein/uncharacterized Fe-S cluster protein YjdI